MTSPEQAPKPKRRLKVEPEPGGQLEQFLIMNKQAHDDSEEAKEREAQYKLAVKNYLLSLFPPAEDGTPHPLLPDSFDIAADPHGRYPAYTMTLKGVGAYRLNTDALKNTEPEKYVQYAVPVVPSWELRENTQGRRR